MIHIVVAGDNIIGQWNPVTKAMINPRLVTLRPAHGGAHIFFQEFVGRPTQVEIPNPQYWFEVKDSGLVAEYIKATTGIIPAVIVPKR